jgi:rubrerythrin
MKEDRERLLNYFEQMKALEESTRDYYIKIYEDRNFEDQEIKDTFKRISEEEQGHADIIEKVITLIKYNI